MYSYWYLTIQKGKRLGQQWRIKSLIRSRRKQSSIRGTEGGKFCTTFMLCRPVRFLHTICLNSPRGSHVHFYTYLRPIALLRLKAMSCKRIQDPAASYQPRNHKTPNGVLEPLQLLRQVTRSRFNSKSVTRQSKSRRAQTPGEAPIKAPKFGCTEDVTAQCGEVLLVGDHNPLATCIEHTNQHTSLSPEDNNPLDYPKGYELSHPRRDQSHRIQALRHSTWIKNYAGAASTVPFLNHSLQWFSGSEFLTRSTCN